MSITNNTTTGKRERFDSPDNGVAERQKFGWNEVRTGGGSTSELQHGVGHSEMMCIAILR